MSLSKSLKIAAMALTAAVVYGCDRMISSSPPKPPPPPPAQKPQSEIQVSIDNFTFKPDVVTIAPGTKVTWVNHDDVPHTVTDKSKLFGSSALDTDDRFSHVFDAAGEFTYFCAVHPHMTGKIIVK